MIKWLLNDSANNVWISEVGSTFISDLSIFVIASRFKAMGIFVFRVHAEVG